VLLQVFKDREAIWKSCRKGVTTKGLSQKEKEEAPVIITNALEHEAFLNIGPNIKIPEDQKTFLVAFPGYDVSSLPAFRKKSL
jgi:hypothetical protein